MYTKPTFLNATLLRLAVAASAVNLLAIAGHAEDVVVRNLSNYLQEIVEGDRLPGMAAVVVSGGDVVASGAAGVRELNKPEQITVNDQFHLASVTKSMTATLCAILVEEGVLRWNTSLGDAFANLDGTMLPEYRHITLRDLLTQRSGIASDVLGDPQVMQKVDEFAKTYPGSPLESRKVCVRSLLSENARSSQNGEFAYSNANYVIAGHMLETMAGHSWEDLIRKRLFEPLGMTTAGFGPPGTVGLVDQPHGHLADGRPVRPGNRDADNPELYGPSGLVHCSVLDWAKFAAIHATQGESHPGLLKVESFAVLHAPVKLAKDSKIEAVAPGAAGYAMGWFVFPGTVLTHSGTNLRWFAVSAVIPKDRLSALVVCNQGGDGAEKCCLKVLQELIKNYHGIRAGKWPPNHS